MEFSLISYDYTNIGLRSGTLSFSSSLDLCQYLAANFDLRGPVQNWLDGWLRDDADVKAMKAKREFLKTLPHFSEYKRRQYDRYHDAARAQALGKANPEQVALANDLNAEIARSQIVVSPGQVLYHGRADHLLASQTSYPAFVSTSLDPVAAMNNAHKRKPPPGANLALYVLTASRPINALWGHVGHSHEWELLLPSGLSAHQTNVVSAGDFDIVEAQIG